MKNDKCPCIDCILMAICRHKMYVKLFQDCCMAKEYVPRYDWLFVDGHADEKETDAKVREICIAIDPIQWYRKKEYDNEEK